jgi:hypothetical protein
MAKMPDEILMVAEDEDMVAMFYVKFRDNASERGMTVSCETEFVCAVPTEELNA